MTKVKICGLKEKEMVDATVDAGADFIGFVFAKSKRQVSAEAVFEMTRNVPAHVKKVGVFVSPTLKQLTETIAKAHLDFVQIHSKMDPSAISNISVPVIQAFNGQDALLNEKLTESSADFCLLDAPAEPAGYAGGNGKSFDWDKVSPTTFQILSQKKAFIAGGLTSENVAEAIHKFTPYAVDVSSSVETAGVKDIQKIRAFIQAVKEI
jgi:phosphoribosylanthranilate isomerase